MFQLLHSSAYIASHFFLHLMLSCQWEGWGCTRIWEGTQLEQVIQTDQRNIPHHMLCSAIKAEGEGYHSWCCSGISWTLVSSCVLYHLFFLAFFPLLSLFPATPHPAPNINLSLSTPITFFFFFHFYPSHSLPHPAVENELHGDWTAYRD